MTYDGAEFVPMATLVQHTLCGTLSGLSKVYRACGYRVGWVVFSGDVEHSREYLSALELLSSLRLCSNVPGQWAVQTALGGYQSIHELIGARRPAVRVAQGDPRRGGSAASYLHAHAADGRDVRVRRRADRRRCPRTSTTSSSRSTCSSTSTCWWRRASSFNVPYRNHFRITNLPEPQVIADVFGRIEELLDSYAAGDQPATRAEPGAAGGGRWRPQLTAAAPPASLTRVTPTRRLAHHLRARHDEACLARGLEVWPTPDIVTWDELIERMFALDRQAGRLAGRWLPASAAQLLWERIVRDDRAAAAALVSPAGVARAAYQSWRRLHDYCMPLDALGTATIRRRPRHSRAGVASTERCCDERRLGRRRAWRQSLVHAVAAAARPRARRLRSAHAAAGGAARSAGQQTGVEVRRVPGVGRAGPQAAASGLPRSGRRNRGGRALGRRAPARARRAARRDRRARARAAPRRGATARGARAGARGRADRRTGPGIAGVRAGRRATPGRAARGGGRPRTARPVRPAGRPRAA